MRLIGDPLVRRMLLDAVAAVPVGARLSIPALRDALVSQADVLVGLQALVDDGSLDRGTLRPFPADAAAADLSAAIHALPIPASFVAPSGAELADRLTEYCTTHGLAQHRVLKHLCIAGFGALRKHQPRSKTVEKILAFLHAPPPPGLEARPAGGPRVPDAGGITGAELAARLDALIAEHGLSKSAVGKRLVGQASGVATIRHSNPRRKTVERILAFLADPPIEELKPRDAWVTRRARMAAGPDDLPLALPVLAPSKPTASGRSFEEQLGRVERGEVGICPNFKIGRPDPSVTLGGVTGEINL